MPTISIPHELLERSEPAHVAAAKARRYRDDILHAFADAISEHSYSPLGTVVSALAPGEAPIESVDDGERYVKATVGMDGERLAKELLEIVAGISLLHQRWNNDVMFE